MELLTPTCPGCGQPPALALTEQYFCDNPECDVFTWNPAMSAVDLMANMNVVDLSGLYVEPE